MVQTRLTLAFAILALAPAAPWFYSDPSDRYASGSPQTLATIEEDAPEDYRANDRDWCHVNDFWTTEVQGLYSLTSDGQLKLIELSVDTAEAVDFRGCDRVTQPVDESRTGDFSDLYKAVQAKPE